MDKSAISNPVLFEQEVRRIAREIFPQSGGYGPIILSGRERDGVLNDGETIHIIEATCNPLKKKAADDLNKSVDLKKEMQKEFPEHNFNIWIITEKDPTADQMIEVDLARKKAKCPVVAKSLRAFSRKLVDASSYLAARDNYHFGSVRPLPSVHSSGSSMQSHFIALDMINIDSKEQVSTTTLAEAIREKKGYGLLLGDFGAGKSMTMRHIYYLARDAFESSNQR